MWQSGAIDGELHAKRVVTDVAWRGLSGGLAAKIGVLLGGAVAGPVGAMTVGALTGVVGSAAGASFADKHNVQNQCRARDKLVRALGEFAAWFADVPLKGRSDALAVRAKEVHDWAWQARAQGVPGDVVTAYETLVRETAARAADLRNWIRRASTDVDKTNAGFVALGQVHHFVHPEISDRVGGVQAALGEFEAPRGT